MLRELIVERVPEIKSTQTITIIITVIKLRNEQNALRMTSDLK